MSIAEALLRQMYDLSFILRSQGFGYSFCDGFLFGYVVSDLINHVENLNTRWKSNSIRACSVFKKVLCFTKARYCPIPSLSRYHCQDKQKKQPHFSFFPELFQ